MRARTSTPRPAAARRSSATVGPSSVSRCKRLVMNARENGHAKGWTAERDLFDELFDTQDQKEGVNAFLEKRPPQWRNA